MSQPRSRQSRGGGRPRLPNRSHSQSQIQSRVQSQSQSQTLPPIPRGQPRHSRRSPSPPSSPVPIDEQDTDIDEYGDDYLENEFDFGRHEAGADDHQDLRVQDLGALDLQRMSAQKSEEAVKLIRNLTRLIVDPKEATKSTRKEIGKALRLLMKGNLYPTTPQIDEVILKITKTEGAHPSLSRWSLETARKIRGKFGFFSRQYFEGVLGVPHLGHLTSPEQAREIVKERQSADEELNEAARNASLRKATIYSARKALGTAGSSYLLRMTERIYRCFLEGRSVYNESEEGSEDWED